MTDHLPTLDESRVAASRPPLPLPQRERWQPLRLGLVELFHYDAEEFWFHDGRLLLRGNNGTGKSKVLSLTLPLLLDAQLRPSRVEPDGDPGKKMAWNLLVGSYPRRIGYSWLEFGRREPDGRLRYLTLGVGLSAVAGRSDVDSWFFLIEGDGATADPRIGQDVWLTTDQRHVLTRERLREALAGRGQLYATAQSYRRAVDERLFQLGSRRYDALVDTLIQLRQPQLSKKPDEAALSNALSESLPPLPNELLGDVAEALNQLEEDRRQLDETRRLLQAVAQFERRYRVYAGMVARRQARELRQAQTAFDSASEARNGAQATLDQARAAEDAAIAAHDAARQALAATRERLETLRSDPANQDANRLEQAETDARNRQHEAGQAVRQRDAARAKLRQEVERGESLATQAESARVALQSARATTTAVAEEVGVEAEVAANTLVSSAVEILAGDPAVTRAGTVAMQAVLSQRRRDLAHVRQRHAETDTARATFDALSEPAQVARDDLRSALAAREQADRAAERAADELLEAWASYGAGLERVRFDVDAVVRDLETWSRRPAGVNPAQTALQAASQSALHAFATRSAELTARGVELRARRDELDAERGRLAAGEEPLPPEPATRAPGIRAPHRGAPLWRIVDFDARLEPDGRAGLEAALEASGLLDAWVSPDGTLTDEAGKPLLDAVWSRRDAVAGTNLTHALIPDLPDDCPVAESTLVGLLAGVAYGTNDEGRAESWVSPDGRFRLGARAGAWRKAEPAYLGRTARDRARLRRIEELDALLAELDAALAEVEQRSEALEAERRLAAQEVERAPSDRALHEAIDAALRAGHDVSRASTRLELVETRRRECEQRWQAARERLERDATDLRLPHEASALASVERRLEALDQARTELAQAVHEWQRAWPAHLDQRQREREAREALERADALAIQTDALAAQVEARLTVLREAVGLKVEALRGEIRVASEACERHEQAVNAAEAERRTRGEQRAVAETQAEQREQSLGERVAERLAAAERLRRFAGSGLLASALPDLTLPDSWSVDPALNLARRIEQELRQVNDDDDAWTRVQRQVSEDLGELQRTLGALGHGAISEPNDWGFTVHVRYQARSERPDTLAARLTEDVAQRSELLSAREREVLENHLQAEIAAEIQRLMRNADERVVAINEELHKRPTSTGVRYRLKWEPLSAEEGGPIGLEAARERLLRTSADLWSAEDRRAIGAMLQQQIASERARADADSAGSALSEQLARALDYRHWHRFRILRHQDGQWRKLSGPASSGERALGLTVPLFAAIASFYGHGGSPLAPRLMLLDEAFAGIDDAARAHCMGLIREFDLDFVITSEREWACYAELPGVAICQLQRREGIDAVFVSRWTWDGRARRAGADPDRRFPPP